MRRFALIVPALALSATSLTAQARPGKSIAVPGAPAPRPDTIHGGKTLAMPAPAGQRPAPVTAAQPNTTAQPNAPAGQGVSSPAGAPSIVAPQATTSAPSANAFTAGLSLPPFTGSFPMAGEYGRTLGQMLDSAVVTLVDVFRNTLGQPTSGATGPDVLSQREKDRWSRCRNLYWDLTTYKTGLDAALPGYASSPAVAHAAAQLDTALTVALADTAATAQCDNVSSMIAAPGRWSPWDQQYQSAAHHFYSAWYDQVLDAHDKDRAFVVALNGMLPAGRRIPVPPALQRNPPYAGASVR